MFNVSRRFSEVRSNIRSTHSSSVNYYTSFFSFSDLNFNCNTLCAKFLISACLPFVFRYRELYGDNKDKNYSEAERYYERASFLSETSGHPHNQVVWS